jgi:hypothetical protein
MSLSTWSFKRVSLGCLAWIVGVPILAAASFAAVTFVLDRFAHGGPTFLNFALPGEVLLAILFVPPAVFLASWLWARRQQSARRKRDPAP